MIDGSGVSCEIVIEWKSLALTDDKSILIQVMAWCCQAPSHYLSQCWPRSMSPYDATRPLWVNTKIYKNPQCSYTMMIYRTIIWVMAWCGQAPSKPLPEPMLTQIYDVTRPQWVNTQMSKNPQCSYTMIIYKTIAGCRYLYPPLHHR